MTSRKLRLALASAGICAFVTWSGAPGAGNDAFDPLLDGGPLCGEGTVGPPAVLRAMVLAEAETAPFQPVPPKPAMGEAPVLYENLGTLHFKTGTRIPRRRHGSTRACASPSRFNHAEAQRAFREAQKLDPAMRALLLGRSARCSAPTSTCR